MNHACLHYRWTLPAKIYTVALEHTAGTAAISSLHLSMSITIAWTRCYMTLAGRGISMPDFSVRTPVAERTPETLLDAYASGC
ncbi:hypothetical protein [Rahnella perminowiae]|uniref:hypothetical protein n=1 Tax=Rahnella perminowiae TaxID=2816244 RepID=UPI00215BC167|nr:hypothetical protein [Rahnella perminowiae]MCR9003249.1 hypothetical protein [Rahnella perminowiae]